MQETNNVSILVISIASPILVGVYINGKLKKEISKEGKTSDTLPLIFDEIVQNFNINKIYYVNGPGSFMAIKVAFIFLKTHCIINNILLKSCSGFKFNNNSPIKALGKKYFFNINNEIFLDFLNDNCKIHSFLLPSELDDNMFTTKNEPDYQLPVIN